MTKQKRKSGYVEMHPFKADNWYKIKLVKRRSLIREFNKNNAIQVGNDKTFNIIHKYTGTTETGTIQRSSFVVMNGETLAFGHSIHDNITEALEEINR